MPEVFNLLAEASGSVGSEVWKDLGAIPLGSLYRMGYVDYTASDKTLLFDIRTNNTGASAGTVAATTSLSAVSIRASTSHTTDLYVKGKKNIHTVVGTGSEHWWLRITAKSSISGGYWYSLHYEQI